MRYSEPICKDLDAEPGIYFSDAALHHDNVRISIDTLTEFHSGNRNSSFDGHLVLEICYFCVHGADNSDFHFNTSLRQNRECGFAECAAGVPAERVHRCCSLKGLHRQDFHTNTSLRQNRECGFAECAAGVPAERVHRCCSLKGLHRQDFQTNTSLRQNRECGFAGCAAGVPAERVHRCCSLKGLYRQDFPIPFPINSFYCG